MAAAVRHQSVNAALRAVSKALNGGRSTANVYDNTISNLRIDESTRVICQGQSSGELLPWARLTLAGFTGEVATKNAKDTIAYGPKVAGGVSPGKGRRDHLRMPLFNTAREVMDNEKPHASAVFVPAAMASEAIIEAIEAEVMPLVVSVAEQIPVQDMLRVHQVLRTQSKTRHFGPNSPGIIAPGRCRIGIMPYKQYPPGVVGIVSRSGTLSYEAVASPLFPHRFVPRMM